MMDAPSWLERFQRSFTHMLRTPLDSSAKIFRADTSRFGQNLQDMIASQAGRNPADELAVYNRQYWFRLFGALQNEYPLTARLLGYWVFNHHAQSFLLQCPPRDQDLARAGDGFSFFLAEQEGVAEGVIQAARIDAAWTSVFYAPDFPIWRPNADEAQRLAELRLVARPSWSMIREDWPLMHLREHVLGDPCEAILPLPPRLATVQEWCLIRARDGIIQMPLDPLQARLYALLNDYPLGAALAKIESDLSGDARHTLLTHVQAWLEQSVQAGFWAAAH